MEAVVDVPESLQVVRIVMVQVHVLSKRNAPVSFASTLGQDPEIELALWSSD